MITRVWNTLIAYLSLVSLDGAYVDSVLALFVATIKNKKLPFNNSKTLADFCVKDASAIVGLATKTLFNFFYPDSEHFLVTEIRFRDGANASLYETLWNAGLTDNDLINGTFNITLNGTIVIKDYPLIEFLSLGAGQSISPTLVLNRPFIWQGQQTLSLVVNTVTAVTTLNTNIQAELKGLKLI